MHVNPILGVKNQSGLTLVEVMIAMAISTILLLTITSMTTLVVRQQQIAKERADLFQMQQQLSYDLLHKTLN